MDGGWRWCRPVLLIGTLALLVCVARGRSAGRTSGLRRTARTRCCRDPRRRCGNVFAISIRRSADGVRLVGILGPGLHLLRMRRVELRPHAAFRDAVRRFRHQPDDLNEFARRDRGVRPVWHCRFRLAIRPVRQSLAARPVTMGSAALSLIWLPYSGFSLVGLSLFAMFYGLDFIATVPPSVRLTAQAFGREQAPLVFGWIFAAHQLGAGLMAFGAGVSRDLLVELPAGIFCCRGVVHRSPRCRCRC